MFMRTVMTLAAALVQLNGNAYAQQPTVFSQQPAAKQTGILVLNMSGELAREYAQMIGTTDGKEPRVGGNFSTTAVIAQRLGNKKVRIEHSVQLKREGGPDRLVTLTADVNKTTMLSLVRTVFKGDFTFSDSPAAKDSRESPTVSASHLSIPFLSLADLKGVKLRSWMLESEVGE